MSDPQDSAEPLQELSPGMPRRHAEYRLADGQRPNFPPTNIGGYDELLAHFQPSGMQLPRSETPCP
ncbi:hypothetical protein FCN77_13320 [Arthrobacter sp. 24S4-2]|uniref:hypothetical protein n=1 Tax=Arthrobacter sp. 24S4-2 TaxID=2575374 RepID=UPI0010C784C0|nr:hypothetical protein [Arthrobacter sp. 24S4-2]QCO98494.1 hypothetical protein FCN77_13320 [Arthrobacter sp. 24S4-2]